MTALAAPEFSLHSSDIKNGKFSNAQFLSESYEFGCSGGNHSPQLSWQNAPAGTKSFVLTVFDRDAPTGFGWIHWVVVNIPASISSLPPGITPAGKNLPSGALQIRTDFGVPGYGGPCPPPGSEHRYEITLIALNIDKLPSVVTADATPALVGFFARASSLGEVKLTVTQGR
ncbi:MAG: YbhB/YbcL family Raf kinase inhibitor-like protein [Desulfocapsaceae bacterium]|nr:YbhB/YbcL family Raf kinase inhibitor-like protein [Desulfocapsaceae bacterium]